MRFTLLLLALGGLAACSTSSTTTSPATPPGSGSADPSAPTTLPGSPAAGAPALSPDGKRFAADTKYQGACAPAGSRGGCYALTFHPDGSAERLLLDATESGKYRIEGKAVLYRSTMPEAQEERFESTDGFRTLGADYHYAP
jgi:hypothetical protein